MAVRPHSPAAAAKQAAYRGRKLAAQVLAARACAAIQQALQTRALADQSWELHERINDWSRDADMPSRGPEGRPSGLVVGASAFFAGMAAARVRRHRRAGSGDRPCLAPLMLLVVLRRLEPYGMG